MASIRKRESGGKTRWQVRWRQGGHGKAETFDTEKKAVTFRGWGRRQQPAVPRVNDG